MTATATASAAKETHGNPIMIATIPENSILLPCGIHVATLDEVFQHFVLDAPQNTHFRRGQIFETLNIHIQLAQEICEGEPLTVWIDGGFVTHKPENPEDADIVYFTSPGGLERLLSTRGTPLWSMDTFRAHRAGDNVRSEKLQPMGGLIDSYVAVDTVINRETWKRRWSDSKGVESGVKGFLEVRVNA